LKEEGYSLVYNDKDFVKIMCIVKRLCFQSYAVDAKILLKFEGHYSSPCSG